MPRGDKSAYSSKQKRRARHIEQSYERRGVLVRRGRAPGLGHGERARGRRPARRQRLAGSQYAPSQDSRPLAELVHEPCRAARAGGRASARSRTSRGRADARGRTRLALARADQNTRRESLARPSGSSPEPRAGVFVCAQLAPVAL
jgi:hypothetical protein